MTEVEQTILRSLTELEQAAKTMKSAGPKPDPAPLLARLDELTWQLPQTADPNLIHYLHKKSYEKARLLLLGRQAENARGSCH